MKSNKNPQVQTWSKLMQKPSSSIKLDCFPSDSSSKTLSALVKESEWNEFKEDVINQLKPDNFQQHQSLLDQMIAYAISKWTLGDLEDELKQKVLDPISLKIQRKNFRKTPELSILKMLNNNGKTNGGKKMLKEFIE